MKIFSFFMLSLMFTSCAVFKGNSEIQTVEIKTNAECDQCKTRLEGELNYIKGIKFAELDVPSKVITVKFDASKISLLEVKNTISKIGYDAGEVKAIPESQKALPACCQPGGMDKQ